MVAFKSTRMMSCWSSALPSSSNLSMSSAVLMARKLAWGSMAWVVLLESSRSKKLVLGFQMGEVLTGEDGGGAFADAAFGLWADYESLHGFLLWLKMDAELLGW